VVKFLNVLTGFMIPHEDAPRFETPAATPPRIIHGAAAAPELCMLAKTWEAAPFAAFTAFPGGQKRVTQIKADGLNAIYVDGSIIGGREGGPLDCALHCQPGLARLEEFMGCPMVFFGEYVAHDGFTATLSEYKAGRGEGTFWIYDAMPHGAWVTGKDYLVPIEQRLEALRDAFDGPATLAKAREVWAAGFEGLQSKAPGSPLVRRRSGDWLKIKERFRAPCEVLDTAMKGGKLHRLIVRGPEPGGSKPLTLSSGWSAAEAETIEIGMREGSQGRIVEVSFELTVGTTRSIRGAAFEGLVA
jgi:hypothetical protein